MEIRKFKEYAIILSFCQLGFIVGYQAQILKLNNSVKDLTCNTDKLVEELEISKEEYSKVVEELSLMKSDISGVKNFQKRMDTLDVISLDYQEEEVVESQQMIYESDLGPLDYALIIDWDNFDLRTKVSCSEEALSKALNWWGQSDNPNPLMLEAKNFLKYSDKYGINLYFICAVAALESGWGQSNLAQVKNNYFGMQTSEGLSFVSYSSFEDSLDNFCRLIKEEYLSEDGQYFSGYTVNDVNKRYNGRDAWAQEVIGLMHDINYNVCNYKACNSEKFISD